MTMKRVAGLLAGWLLAGGAGSAWADSTQKHKHLTVTVTVQKISVAISPSSIGFGTVAESFVGVHGTTVVVTNDGNIQEDMQLDGGSAPAGWTKVASDAPGTDEYDIRALFAAELGPLASTDFSSADDTLSGSPVTATGTQFARTGDVAGVKGFDLAVSSARNLYIQFRAPSFNTVSSAQTVTVTVTAIAG